MCIQTLNRRICPVIRTQLKSSVLFLSPLTCFSSQHFFHGGRKEEGKKVCWRLSVSNFSPPLSHSLTLPLPPSLFLSLYTSQFPNVPPSPTLCFLLVPLSFSVSHYFFCLYLLHVCFLSLSFLYDPPPLPPSPPTSGRSLSETTSVQKINPSSSL